MNAIGKLAVSEVANQCRSLVAQIENVRRSVQSEFAGALATQQRVLKLALNEAEALAWQTAYPHLVFPALAREKAEAAAAWAEHQRAIRRETFRELAVA